jgi:hypothetical protein
LRCKKIRLPRLCARLEVLGLTNVCDSGPSQMFSGDVQDERWQCNARLHEISGLKSDMHHESQGRASERKLVQQQLTQIKAVAAKRIQVWRPCAKAQASSCVLPSLGIEYRLPYQFES